MPFFFSIYAVSSPAMPPPTTSTSVLRSPISGPRSGTSASASCHMDCFIAFPSAHSMDEIRAIMANIRKKNGAQTRASYARGSQCQTKGSGSWRGGVTAWASHHSGLLPERASSLCPPLRLIVPSARKYMRTYSETPNAAACSAGAMRGKISAVIFSCDVYDNAVEVVGHNRFDGISRPPEHNISRFWREHTSLQLQSIVIADEYGQLMMAYNFVRIAFSPVGTSKPLNSPQLSTIGRKRIFGQIHCIPRPRFSYNHYLAPKIRPLNPPAGKKGTEAAAYCRRLPFCQSSMAALRERMS